MRRRVILAGLVLVPIAVLLLLSPWRDWLAAAPSALRAAGPAGAVLLGLAYLPLGVLAVPTWPLTALAGASLGVARGFPLALAGSAAGASLAFLAGRTLLRERVAARVARDPRLLALDEAVSRQGAVLILLLRLSPFAPANVVNYALAASRVRFAAFAAASAVGMAPLTLAWTWAGAALGGVTGAPDRLLPEPWGLVVRWVGLAATGAVVLLLGRMARRALARRVP